MANARLCSPAVPGGPAWRPQPGGPEVLASTPAFLPVWLLSGAQRPGTGRLRRPGADCRVAAGEAAAGCGREAGGWVVRQWWPRSAVGLQD